MDKVYEQLVKLFSGEFHRMNTFDDKSTLVQVMLAAVMQQAILPEPMLTHIYVTIWRDWRH